MKFDELVFDQSVIVQIVWGEQKIEFPSKVLKRIENSVYITPYIHNGKPLSFNIENNDGVVCNLFADDKVNNKRVSWKNIKLKTEELNGETTYCLKTSVFNQMGGQDDRRVHERIIITKKARIFDPQTDKYTEILIHDISDIGISFYAPTSFVPKSNQITIDFVDAVDDKCFNLKVECSITRTDNKAGNVFYGCRIVGENRDYLVYGFLRRLKKKNNDKY